MPPLVYVSPYASLKVSVMQDLQNSFWSCLALGHCSNGISPLKIERETLKGRRFRTVMNIAAASTTLLKYTTTIV